MKLKSLIAALLFALALRLPAATNDLTTRLQQGLFDEEASRDLNAAIADYQALAAQFDQDRQVAATAIYRLGECYRKLGQTNDAVTQYQRLIREFADQKDLITLSRQNLTGLGADAPSHFTERLQASIASTGADAKSDTALQTQKQLLAEEIKAVEQQLSTAQIQVQTGTLPADGTLTTKTKLLELKRQLTALGAGQPVTVAAETAPTTDEEAQEIIRIQQMIQNSPDLINSPRGVTRDTPLRRAAANGWLKVAAYLLDHGADVNAGSNSGLTPLYNAARAGNRAMVELLISRGAEVNPTANRTGLGVPSPLDIAISQGFPAVVQSLITAKADVNAVDMDGRTPLIRAVANGQDKITQLLLAAGANPNGKSNDGTSPLMEAAQSASANTVKALLAAGADANATNNSGRTVLSYAAEFRSVAELQMLLDAKADPNGGTLDAPLMCAIGKSDLATVECLLKAGANPNVNGAVDGQLSLSVPRAGPIGGFSGGRSSLPGTEQTSLANFHQTATPLFFALWTDQLPMVQLLLKYHADPNDSQTDGRPLIFSALSYPDILTALLAAGANVDARDPSLIVNGVSKNSNWTPLISALREDRSPVVVETLLNHGANPNLSDDAYGYTPLQWCGNIARVPNRTIVELLLAHHADPNVRDQNGFTLLERLKSNGPNASPLDLAEMASVADLLRQHGALDQLPDWNHITVSRPSANVARLPFTRQTNEWNQFTLLELIAVQCRFLAATPASTGEYHDKSVFFGPNHQPFPFPDLTRLRILRPSPDGKTNQEIIVNLGSALQTGDATNDVPLAWGDVVEIPETDHSLNETWPGFSDMELRNLQKCLTRQVSILIKGQTNILTLAPKLMFSGEHIPVVTAGTQLSYPVNTEIRSEVPYWLGPVLLQSKLVLTSSDLSRVKVIRHDPKLDKTREWTVDCSGISQNKFNDNDVWLRDGDVIEVPEKP